jgi:ABC-type Fe3+ transport system substrate-binding protein
VSDVLVYAVASRAQTVRTVLGLACQATGVGARLELYGTGSLYQRLGPRHAAPPPDVILWFGPFAAQAAANDGLLQPYQPAATADAAVHDPNWRWTTLDYLSVGALGTPAANNLADAAGVPKLALADPERSEVGMSILLATLDGSRQTLGDVERGWSWWQQRARSGVVLTEDDAGAVTAVGEGGVTHALSLVETAALLGGLAPVPNAIGLAASSRNVDAARRMLDWLTVEAASVALPKSPWQAANNGLAQQLAAAPPLDVAWCQQNYTAARQRWAASGFAPTLQA